MSTYVNSTSNGSSSSLLDNKLVLDGTIKNKVSIKNLDPQANIENIQVKTINSSVSLLQNNIYNRFSSIPPTVIYSLKK